MSDVSVAPAGPVGMVTLRGDLADLAGPVRNVTGCALPERRMMTRAGDRAVLWMSRDELLVTCGFDEAAELAARLEAALGDAFATAAVVSDARAAFDVTGSGARRVLAKLCPVDFERLAPEEVRRTRMAQVAAALWRHGDGWRVVCFRSVERYAEALLRDAAA